MKLRRGLKIFWLLVSVFTFSLSAFAHQIPEGSVPFEKSSKCSACHLAIYKEWEASMHSKSSLFIDKAHGAMHSAYTNDMIKSGNPKDYHCGNCHTPMAENVDDFITGKSMPTGKDWKEMEGVGCTFCHRIESIIHAKRFNSYSINKDGALTVSNPSGKSPHKTAKSNIFGNGVLCMGCHSHMVTPKGTPVCVMKEEGEIGNCLSCHMEQTEGEPASGSKKKTHKSHIMAGGHDLNTLKNAITLDARVEQREGNKELIVDVKNIIAHTFPSTNPMRMAFLKVSAKDMDGNTVWSNFTESPMEDKKSLFMKAFKAGDKMGVPPWKAESVGMDTRIKYGEKRTITYTLPKKDIKNITVFMFYRLFPPKAIEMMGVPKDGVNEKNHVVAKKEISL